MGAVLFASFEQGLIFSLLAIGVVLTFKVLKISDLSVEGTFPLGAFIFARAAMTGINPILGTALAFVCGCLAGGLTYFLYKKINIAALLAGILTMTILYSVNLKITGRSNVPLFKFENIFNYFNNNKVLVMIAVVIFVKLIMDWFFNTEKGYLLTVTGDNESLVKALGQNPNKYTLIGLVLANGLVSLSGAFMAQSQGFVDISMGQSIIVTALASIIIGDTIFKDSKKLKITTRAILGAIIYRIIFGIAIHVGIDPNDLKAITAFIVIGFIAYNNFTSTGLARLKLLKRERE